MKRRPFVEWALIDAPAPDRMRVETALHTITNYRTTQGPLVHYTVGASNNTLCGRVFEWDGANWSERNANGPHPGMCTRCVQSVVRADERAKVYQTAQENRERRRTRLRAEEDAKPRPRSRPEAQLQGLLCSWSAASASNDIDVDDEEEAA